MRQIVMVAALAALAAGSPAIAHALSGESTTMAKDEKIVVVEKMVDAWNRRDWQMVGDLFTEDGVLHSMMIEPVKGREAISKRISGMGAGIESITLNIRNIGRVGDVVMIERVDEFVYKGHAGKVPVVGVIETRGDKISEWREYYDRAELLEAMGLAEDFHKPAG